MYCAFKTIVIRNHSDVLNFSLRHYLFNWFLKTAIITIKQGIFRNSIDLFGNNIVSLQFHDFSNE